MSVTPKSMWPAVKAMLHSVYDQPDARCRINIVTTTDPEIGADHLPALTA